jgi:hypothetical protein
MTFLDGLRRLMKSLLSASADDEIRPFCRQLLGDRAAQPFAARGYEGDLAAKSEIQAYRLR